MKVCCRTLGRPYNGCRPNQKQKCTRAPAASALKKYQPPTQPSQHPCKQPCTMLFNEKLVNVIKILNTSGVRSVYGEMNRTGRWTSKQAKKPQLAAQIVSVPMIQASRGVTHKRAAGKVFDSLSMLPATPATSLLCSLSFTGSCSNRNSKETPSVCLPQPLKNRKFLSTGLFLMTT